MYLLVNKKMILDIGKLNQTFTKYGMAIPMSAHQVPGLSNTSNFQIIEHTIF